jgi:hypothetical protein
VSSTHVYVTHNAERMLTEVRVVRRYETGDPLILSPTGGWLQTEAGYDTAPSFVIPDDVQLDVMRALAGQPADTYLAEALRVERARVDNMTDRLLDKVLG